MWGFTFPQTSVAKGSEIKGFALFVILGTDIMKVSFNKKIDTTFKRLQYHSSEKNMDKVLDHLPPFTYNTIVKYVRNSGKNIQHSPKIMIIMSLFLLRARNTVARAVA